MNRKLELIIWVVVGIVLLNIVGSSTFLGISEYAFIASIGILIGYVVFVVKRLRKQSQKIKT